MFYEQFIECCRGKDVSRTKACTDCGVSRTAWHKWENGAIPNGSTLNKFAEYFNVSVSFLLGAESENPTVQTDSGVSDRDIKLLEWFHSLPEEKRKAILSLGGAPEDLV